MSTPLSLSPPTIHSALLLTGIELPPYCGVHGRPAAIPTGNRTLLKPFRQWHGCTSALIRYFYYPKAII